MDKLNKKHQKRVEVLVEVTDGPGVQPKRRKHSPDNCSTRACESLKVNTT